MILLTIAWLGVCRLQFSPALASTLNPQPVYQPPQHQQQKTTTVTIAETDDEREKTKMRR